jgi:hypothetical protein
VIEPHNHIVYKQSWTQVLVRQSSSLLPQRDTSSNMLHTRALLEVASAFTLVAALPATGPNDDDFACFSSYREHDSSSRAFEELYTTEVASVREWIAKQTDRNVPLTTLCDGRSRALEPYKTFEVTSTETLNPPETTTRYSTYAGSSPTCAIAATACAAIESAFPDDVFHCETPAPYFPCSIDPDHCDILGKDRNTLFYWPVTTVSGDFCAQNGSTVFAEPTSPPEPNKVVIDGYTFTSPTNYVSFEGARALIRSSWPQTTACGPPAHTNVIVPITESFYSMGYYDAGKRSFNFADLAPNPIPADAYGRQAKCGQKRTCTGVIVGSYTPILPLPTEILNLEPEEWRSAGCTGTNLGYAFTPIALVTPAPTNSS